MDRHPVAVVILCITYAWTMKGDYSRFSWGGLYSFSTSALVGCGWSAPRLGRFTLGKDTVPIVQEAGWAPRPVWTFAKNLAPTGIFFLVKSEVLIQVLMWSQVFWIILDCIDFYDSRASSSECLIRSPDHPVRSQSLYRLSYPDHYLPSNDSK
jgi:hypothetical protein